MAPKFFRLLFCRVLAVSAALSLAYGSARAEDTLSLVLGRTPELMNTLNQVAQGAGFYKDEQLKVTETRVKSSLEAQTACSAGQFDICPIGIEPLITNYGRGTRLQMFLTRAAKFTYVYAVLDDSPITSLADFKGKTIGVHSSDGASATAATQSGLEVAGVKASEYRLVTVGKDGDAIEALVSGKVDAAALPYYEFIPFIVAGRKLRIFPHPALQNVTNSGYASAPRVLAAKGPEVQRFSRAMQAVGPDLADLLFDICCHLSTLEHAETRRSWSRRSGRVVLGIALDRLADHYGLRMTAPRRSGSPSCRRRVPEPQRCCARSRTRRSS